MDPNNLKDHILIIRSAVAGFLFFYLFLGLIMIEAIGLTVGWNSAVLPGLLGSGTLSALIFIAATPIAMRVTSSAVGLLYVRTLIRLASALLVGQSGVFLSFMLDAGITPGLLGGGSAILMLVVGVWPRHSTLSRYANRNDA
ncbi:MAG TPA: hypothetical protein VF174_04480 [Micromonosporaceae bacterium]